MNGDSTSEERQAAETLEVHVARLLANRATPLPPGLDHDEVLAYLAAGELAGHRPGTQPPAEVLARLEARLDQAIARHQERAVEARTPLRVSRRRSLLAAAGAAGVLVGVALDRELPGMGHPALLGLVGARGRWYDVADAATLPAATARRFSAGGVDGYLLHRGGQVYALSAICTHMGCHIDWRDAHGRFECLCHGAAFSSRGQVVAGVPPGPLPAIEVRVHQGRIYAWGTLASTWG